MSTTTTFSDGTTSEPDPWTVDFSGVDGRRRAYDFSELPCPALHADLKRAFATTIKQAGSLSTADVYFTTLRRFLSFLGTLGETFDALSALRPRHFDQYRASRAVAVSTDARYREMAVLFRLLKNAPYGSLCPELGNQVLQPGRPGQSGQFTTRPVPSAPLFYSQHEFEQVLDAARQDAAAIRDRIESQGPCTINRQGLTAQDLAPLLVLATRLTLLRPSEIHDLPASHELAQDSRMVQVRTRRDRRPGELFTLRWPVGGRQSERPQLAGDLYLMVHQLTEGARRACGSERLWCVWTPAGARVPARTSLAPLLNEWAASRRLVGDDGNPLPVALSRVRTTARLADGS
ncbi:hypothetical protein [Kitasatospora sp. NPDC056184]|uniref:hypothetical protein n=1 Tax=Kitasatospora sp. NPDC056184 TaxID=3345738 RepID=UPI0035DF2FB4